MALTTRHRQGERLSIPSQMDRLFHQMLNGTWLPLGEQLLGPRVDVSKNEREVVLTAELPGLAASDLEVEVSDELITLSGEFKQESERDEDEYYWSERRFGTFIRSVPMPVSIKSSEAKASFKNGVLTIHAPLAESARLPRARKLDIES